MWVARRGEVVIKQAIMFKYTLQSTVSVGLMKTGWAPDRGKHPTRIKRFISHSPAGNLQQ